MCGRATSFVDVLREKGFSVITTRPTPWLSSGCCIATRLPVKGASFQAFKSDGNIGWHSVVPKGVLRASLGAGPVVLDVSTVHLHSDNVILSTPAKDQVVKMAQLKETSAFLKDRSKHWIVAGDFNLGDDSPSRVLGGVDVFGLAPREPTYNPESYLAPHVWGASAEPERFDRVLTNVQTLRTELLPNSGLSDHRFLSVTLGL